MAAQHTPGPWGIAPSAIYTVYSSAGLEDPEGVPVADCSVPPGDSRSALECEANARLTAVAPDLLAALRLALEYWAHRQQRYKNRHPVWVQDAHAAIAKVEGRL